MSTWDGCAYCGHSWEWHLYGDKDCMCGCMQYAGSRA